MRILSRTSVVGLLIAGLCVAPRHASAQLTGNDLTVMQALATPLSQGGYGWGTAFSSWNPNTNPCPVSGSANWAGVTCNRQGRVVIIVAVCNATKINQPLPSIMSQLTALTSLDVRDCGMYGTIPEAWQTMTQ